MRYYQAAALLLAALPLAAQHPKPNVKTTAPAPSDMAETLLTEAKAALQNVPEFVRPMDRLDIALAESIRHPKQAQEGFELAFRSALALEPAQGDNDAAGQAREQEKRYVEDEAIVHLSNQGPAGFAIAHELVRQADVPRGRIYSQLIAAASSWAQRKAGRTFPAEQALLARTFGGIGFTQASVKRPAAAAPGYSVLELAQECYQGDGTFPYLGVMIALTAYHAPGNDQRPLLLYAYQIAGQEKQTQGVAEAIRLLSDGHAVYPGLDEQMESAATSLLAHLQADIQAMPSGGSPQRQHYYSELAREDKVAAYRLLAVLDQVDNTRAQDLRTQYPLFATAKKLEVPPIPIRSLTAKQRQQNADPSTALADANHMPTISDAEKAAKFRTLVNLAINLAQANPQSAAAAAGEARDLMTKALVSDNVDRVALLALRLDQEVHEPGAATALMLQALDAAEKIAVSKEKAYDNAGSEQQPALAGDFEGDGAPELNVFVYAAQMDLNLAMARAQQTSATYFEPLFLERVAVGYEMRQPWWQAGTK